MLPKSRTFQSREGVPLLAVSPGCPLLPAVPRETSLRRTKNQKSTNLATSPSPTQRDASEPQWLSEGFSLNIDTVVRKRQSGGR